MEFALNLSHEEEAFDGVCRIIKFVLDPDKSAILQGTRSELAAILCTLQLWPHNITHPEGISEVFFSNHFIFEKKSFPSAH